MSKPNPTGFNGLPGSQPCPVSIFLGKKPFSVREERKPGGIATLKHWVPTLSV